MRGIPAGSDGVAGGGQGTFVVRWSSGLALTGVQKATMVMAAVGLLSASAYLSVPFFPVPLTMQTLAVLLIGGMLGPMLGASAVAGYIALGMAGAPVFHNGLAGPAVLAGPTGGYLIGFIAAAFVMGIAVQWAARIGRRGGAGAGDGAGSGADGSGQRASLTGWTSCRGAGRRRAGGECGRLRRGGALAGRLHRRRPRRGCECRSRSVPAG